MNAFTDASDPRIQPFEACQYLLTEQIDKVVGQYVEVSVTTAGVGDKTFNVGPIEDVRAIEPSPESDVAIFGFANYVAYAVTAETFAQNNEDEVFVGNRIRIYSKSHFLDFVRRTTWASAEYPGPLVHYQINTLDHSIDVVTSQPPELMVKKGVF